MKNNRQKKIISTSPEKSPIQDFLIDLKKRIGNQNIDYIQQSVTYYKRNKKNFGVTLPKFEEFCSTFKRDGNSGKTMDQLKKFILPEIEEILKNTTK